MCRAASTGREGRGAGFVRTLNAAIAARARRNQAALVLARRHELQLSNKTVIITVLRDLKKRRVIEPKHIIFVEPELMQRVGALAHSLRRRLWLPCRLAGLRVGIFRRAARRVGVNIPAHVVRARFPRTYASKASPQQEGRQSLSICRSVDNCADDSFFRGTVYIVLSLQDAAGGPKELPLSMCSMPIT